MMAARVVQMVQWIQWMLHGGDGIYRDRRDRRKCRATVWVMVGARLRGLLPRIVLDGLATVSVAR